jgi:hypothetical protein
MIIIQYYNGQEVKYSAKNETLIREFIKYDLLYRSAWKLYEDSLVSTVELNDIACKLQNYRYQFESKNIELPSYFMPNNFFINTGFKVLETNGEIIIEIQVE